MGHERWRRQVAGGDEKSDGGLASERAAAAEVGCASVENGERKGLNARGRSSLLSYIRIAHVCPCVSSNRRDILFTTSNKKIINCVKK